MRRISSQIVEAGISSEGEFGIMFGLSKVEGYYQSDTRFDYLRRDVCILYHLRPHRTSETAPPSVHVSHFQSAVI